MNSESQSLLAVFAHCFPQAQIILITSEHAYALNLFIADEGITHFVSVSRAHFPSVPQLADFIDVAHFIDLIDLSPVALRLDIKDEAGHFSFISRAVALA